ncbi:pyruvate:ferredoxin (flavodoxin) oxidoreductase [Labilibaculum sp. A4]|uniref:pyruvate:ferredoxin (flavodoxin) oxidoreductase n=1 Tax=Labilibaculum euxinus TaxID=2686357 RepID=UPI000F61D30E|nr:pyruvate:ferredoxin (flavodoxin) oxidoreductase [Labilibaculum euxinus]MDQ1769557.1 pyruvate:ferredoxin (flavodoxin) oxidoreductase [Labilibaculum euxinus]MWN75082.1 pyruvate:ferredoxin (flavodoxin) oxidoreductase [Labilibaculum euxinus]
MAREKKFITCDGNAAAAHVAYMFSEVSCIYPITPSSPMAENVDEWAAQGRKNLFGETVQLVEMQSEAGAAGAVHGALQAGALTTTYTASQGLLLMIPNMYKIAGELLPCVFHISARALAAQALSIFGDHSDVYSARQTGFAMLASGSVQEVMDLSAVSHLTAIKSRVPFMNFFDGFRTSHEIQKIEAVDMEDMRDLVDQEALQAFRDRALNPESPVTRGTAQNPDVYFQSREAANPFYNAVPDIVADYMKEMTKITGREYKPFMYYGAADAENIIIAMGSVNETIKEAVDYKMANGEKVGLVCVHLYRPFSAKHFLSVIPESVKRICVLDRTKETGANGDPLYLDVREVFYGRENAPMVIGGRYGLGSKEVTPSQIVAVYKNLAMNEPKNQFTLGIVDDVTFTSLPMLPEVKMNSESLYEAKFYGLGSDGTVGANKNSIKIIGGSTDKYCQAYFAYDSKKSGGFTASHLRFGDEPIRSTYLVTTPDFVACHVPAYVYLYDVLKGLKKGGSFLLNSIYDAEETVKNLPNHMKKYLAENEIKFYIINGTKLGEELGLGNRTNTIMQAAFFKITNVIPFEKAAEEMKKAIVKSYGNKGEKVVNMNFSAVDAGGENVVEVKVSADWKNLPEEKEAATTNNRPKFIAEVCDPMNAQKGDDLPVSVFAGREDGTFPAGTTKFEKRGVAVSVPEWQEETCIQCNQCAYVCPHAAIRPFILTEEELAAAPAGTAVKPATGKELKGLHFRIQVAVEDCTGCGNCVDVCPAPKAKALVLKHLETQDVEKERWHYMDEKVGYKDLLPKNNVKNSQFAQPLFEFSGACAGCGETPYIKLITQLFGERMMVANATGCSSIYGGSAPATPYCKNNKSGKGPAWANSLFEDNAEFGFGMNEGVRKMRNRIALRMEAAMEAVNAETKAAFTEWLENKDNGELSIEASAKVESALANETHPVAKEVLDLKNFLIKKSQWIFGGDGWAYDIGFGGLDHVLASGEDVNVLVMDTEIYSNTGGQASKATPVGAVAKFAAAGKRIRKKDLGMIAMSYGYVYVAQVAMGANQAQYMKAVKEAEAYPGPSLIIAYSPCISHGLKASMGKSQAEEKKAVEAGYWHLYRNNPALENEGKNPFTLDSKEPVWENFQNFLLGEVRYTSLQKSFPEQAKELFVAAEENAKWRYKTYKRQASMDYTEE